MGKLNHQVKKSLVKKYADMLDAGQIIPDDLFVAIRAEEKIADDDQANEVLVELRDEETAKVKVEPYQNQIFEEWKVDARKVDGEWQFEQLKKIRNVKISQDMADRMNEQSRNSRLRYYLPA